MRALHTLIERPVAVSMAMLIIVVTGLYATLHLPLELTPQAELPKISVNTAWPNASPEAVEAFVTAPIEGVAAALPGVQTLTSTSSEGRSTVSIEFTPKTKVDFIALQLADQLSLIKAEFPHDVRPPRIEPYVPEAFRQEAFLQYQFSGPYSLYEIRQFALNYLRPALQQIDGIAAVHVQGGQDAEVHILLDRDKLVNFGLTPERVAASLLDLNVRTQAGLLPGRQVSTDLLVLNPVQRIDELRALPVQGTAGRVQLRDIATVQRAYENVSSLVRIDGQPSVSLSIEREAGSNLIAVANAVFARLEALVVELPPGLRLLKIHDQSEQIRADLRALSSRSFFCLLVILLVLVLFLGSFRLPLLVMSTVAFAILLTLNLFYFADLTLNILTLAGLALGFGMLVDNAIVVIDNIHRRRELGEAPVTAAVQGTREMLLPLAAATLTTVVVFVPFLYLTGELRVFYLPFTTAVCLALLSSLAVSLLFTPVIAARSVPQPHRRFDRIVGIYQRGLRFGLRWPLLPILAAAGLFYYAWVQFDKNVTRGEIWRWGGDTYLAVHVRLPKGAQMQRADDIARVFEDKVVGLSGITRITTYVYPERLYVRINFPEHVVMTAYPHILKEQLSVLASRFAGINIGVSGFGPGFFSSGLSTSMPNFRIKVLGYNFDEVRRIAEEIGQQLERNRRVREINTSGSGRWWSASAQTETVLRIRRERLPQHHLTVADVVGQVAAYLRENQQWQQLRLGRDQLEYRVKYADFEQFDQEDLFDVALQASDGSLVRLREVAEIAEREVQSEIVRENQQYQRWITFEYRGPHKFGQRVVDAIIENTQLPPGYKLEQPRWFLSEEEKLELYTVLALSILLVFMVTAALYESLVQPFIIMLTVPLALIGVFLIFWLSETNFDRSAYIGVVLLSGIVVNNAILLVERTSRLRREGMAIDDAILAGAGQRLRPILMTTATTVFGLLPLVAAGGESRLWGTLALATIGGLCSSALLVLAVTPALYRILVREAR